VRLSPFLVPLLLAGCAGHPGPAPSRPPAGHYRVPGLAPTPTPFSPEDGALGYQLEPGGAGVWYRVEVALEGGGELRVITLVENRGQAPARYDLRRAVVTDAAGVPLRQATLQEDSTRRPAPAQRRSPDYRDGVREVAPGEGLVVTRRYSPSSEELTEPGRLLGRLALEDELAVDDRSEPVSLQLEKAR
jgi:hypothetical protein